jgi:hypothetical protein
MATPKIKDRPLKKPGPVAKVKTTMQIARESGRYGDCEDTWWHHLFLDALRLKPNVSHACKHAKVARRTAYYHKETHPEFSKEWDDALEEGRDLIELGMIEAAQAGDQKAREFLLHKWRYNMGQLGKNIKKPEEEPKTVTVQWGK